MKTVRPFIQTSTVTAASYLRAIISILILLALTSGCSLPGIFFGTAEPKQEKIAVLVKSLINEGMQDFNRGKYHTAMEHFSKVLETYRFSPEAVLAELKIADCNYYLDNYSEAFTAYERFERLHPTNEAIPYVMYQKAMCHYNKIDRIDRDTTGAKKSIDYFNQLVKAYPESPYTADAKEKISFAREFLADHEYNVARYYQRSKKHRQATGRLQYLLAVYPDTQIATKAKQLLDELKASSVD